MALVGKIGKWSMIIFYIGIFVYKVRWNRGLGIGFENERKKEGIGDCFEDEWMSYLVIEWVYNLLF